MKHFLLGGLIFLMQFPFAQRRQIDSLLNLIKYDKDDTIKVKHLIDLGLKYENLRHFDSTLFFANSSYQLAEKLNYKIGIAAFWRMKGHICLHKGDRSNALNFLSKSLKMEEEIGNKKGVALSLHKIGVFYSSMQRDYTLALDYYSKAENIFKEIRDTFNIALVLAARVDINLYKLEYQEAIKNVSNALQLYQKINYAAGIALSYNSLGEIFLHLHDYSQAMDYFLRALKIYEETNDKLGLRNIFNALGMFYNEEEDHEMAKKYLFKALAFSEEVGDDYESAHILINLGNLYSHFKNIVTAIDFYKKAFEYSKKANDKIGIAHFFDLIARLYSTDKNPAENLKFNLLALRLFEEEGHNYGIYSVRAHIGHAYIHLRKYSEAKKYLFKALATADTLRMSNDVKVINGYLQELYTNTGNYKKALECSDIRESIKDSLFNLNNTREITRKEMNYEFERKTALAKAEKERERQEFKNQKARLTLIIYLIVSLLLTGGSLGLYIYARIKKTRVLAEQQKLLQATIETQEQERKRIAKDLHDGVGQSLVILKTTLADIEKVVDANNSRLFDAGTKRLNEVIDEVRNVSHQMMPMVLTQFGLTEALCDLLNDNKLPFSCKFEATPLKERLSSNIEINLYRIIQELINNITKHSQATKVEVQLYTIENQLMITVEDNGRGFNINEASSKKGMGISNIKSRLQSINGEIVFEKSHNSGTLVIIKVPVS